MNTLDPEKIEVIHAALKAGLSRRKISNLFGVHRATIKQHAERLGHTYSRPKKLKPITIQVDDSTRQALVAKATKLGLSTSNLVGLILKTVVKADLISDLVLAKWPEHCDD